MEADAGADLWRIGDWTFAGKLFWFACCIPLEGEVNLGRSNSCLGQKEHLESARALNRQNISAVSVRFNMILKTSKNNALPRWCRCVEGRHFTWYLQCFCRNNIFYRSECSVSYMCLKPYDSWVKSNVMWKFPRISTRDTWNALSFFQHSHRIIDPIGIVFDGKMNEGRTKRKQWYS